jgi:hypothetical protein
VIDAEPRRPSPGDKDAIQLKSEALGDLARFFSYVDEVETAFAYFKKKGGEDIAIRYTARSAGCSTSRASGISRSRRTACSSRSTRASPRRPQLQSLIVTAYSKLNDKEQVRKEVERLVDLYRPGTPWYREHESARRTRRPSSTPTT